MKFGEVVQAPPKLATAPHQLEHTSKPNKVVLNCIVLQRYITLVLGKVLSIPLSSPTASYLNV